MVAPRGSNSEHARIKEILAQSIVDLCASVVSSNSQLRVDGLVGITIDQSEVLLISISEIYYNGQGSNAGKNSIHMSHHSARGEPQLGSQHGLLPLADSQASPQITRRRGGSKRLSCPPSVSASILKLTPNTRRSKEEKLEAVENYYKMVGQISLVTVGSLLSGDDVQMDIKTEPVEEESRFRDDQRRVENDSLDDISGNNDMTEPVDKKFVRKMKKSKTVFKTMRHSVNRMYSCPKCSKCFQAMKFVELHLNKKHGLIPANDTAQSAIRKIRNKRRENCDKSETSPSTLPAKTVIKSTRNRQTKIAVNLVASPSAVETMSDSPESIPRVNTDIAAVPSCPKCFHKFVKLDHVKEHLLLKHSLLPVTNSIGLNPYKPGCSLRKATEDEVARRMQSKWSFDLNKVRSSKTWNAAVPVVSERDEGTGTPRKKPRMFDETKQELFKYHEKCERRGGTTANGRGDAPASIRSRSGSFVEDEHHEGMYTNNCMTKVKLAAAEEAGSRPELEDIMTGSA